MIPKNSEGYISIIGTNFLFPITTLLEEMEKLKVKEPNEVQTSPRENGCAVAIITLAVLFLESMISRTQYITEVVPPKKPIEFLKSTFPDSGFQNQIEELFVLRDVIAHNHVWEATFFWDDELGMKLDAADLTKGYGDNKFNRVLNQKTRKTHKLELNLFPTRICRSDAIIVLKQVVAFLLFLEEKNKNYVYISPQWVKYNGNMILFTKIIEELQMN